MRLIARNEIRDEIGAILCMGASTMHPDFEMLQFEKHSKFKYIEDVMSQTASLSGDYDCVWTHTFGRLGSRLYQTRELAIPHEAELKEVMHLIQISRINVRPDMHAVKMRRFILLTLRYVVM